ncbi:MAG TPA: hypothetical protein VF533_23735 [Solirubrobacteraceae bacterium]
MPFRVTVRHGSAVQRTRSATLPEALDVLEAAAREVARTSRPATIEMRVRRYEPRDQVVARIEVTGPQRLSPSVRAGVDVRGDGSMTAHVGRARREAVEEREDESALQALRRLLLDG